MSKKGDPIGIFVDTMYGAQTHEPLVMLRFGDQKPWNLRTEEARRVAHMLIEAAESAEQDGFLIEWFMEEMDVPAHQAAALLTKFREHRVKWVREER